MDVFQGLQEYNAVAMFRVREVQTFLDTRTREFLSRRLKAAVAEEGWDLVCKELADEVPELTL